MMEILRNIYELMNEARHKETIADYESALEIYKEAIARIEMLENKDIFCVEYKNMLYSRLRDCADIAIRRNLLNAKEHLKMNDLKAALYYLNNAERIYQDIKNILEDNILEKEIRQLTNHILLEKMFYGIRDP